MATPLGVELAAIVTGPLRLFDPHAKPIEPAELAEAATVEKEIADAIRAFMKQKSRRPAGDEPAELDYKATLAMVTSQVPLERRLEVTKLLDPNLSPQYVAQFDRVARFLSGAIPRRQIVTLTGMQFVEPPDLELWPFWRALEVVEDPRVLLRDLREGILVSDQVAVLQQNYPETHKVFTRATLDALAEVRDEDLDTWHEQQIEVLLQISRVSPELLAELQARARAAEMQERQEEAAPPKPTGTQDKVANAFQTPVQRVALK